MLTENICIQVPNPININYHCVSILFFFPKLIQFLILYLCYIVYFLMLNVFNCILYGLIKGYLQQCFTYHVKYQEVSTYLLDLDSSCAILPLKSQLPPHAVLYYDMYTN